MPKAKVKRSKYIFMLLRIAVVVCGIIWAVFWLSGEEKYSGQQRWRGLVEIFREMNIWIFACALGIYIVSAIIIGLRWWLLLRTQSIFIDLATAVRLHFLGLFYNNFMPSSVGGDLLRAWYVTKHTDKGFEAALSVFVDRLIGLLSTLVIAIFFYLLFLAGQGKAITFESQGGLLKSAAEYKWFVFYAVVAVGVVFCGFLLHRRGRAIVKKVWSSVCMYGVRMIKKLRDATILYCSKPMTILAVFTLTVFLQLLTITGFWFLGVNLGIAVSIKYYYVLFTLTWVFGAVPVSIGGAVVVEGMLYILFTQVAGVEKEAALAIALCQRAIWMLGSLPGAVIHLIGAHLPKEFFVDYNEPLN